MRLVQNNNIKRYKNNINIIFVIDYTINLIFINDKVN